MLPLQLSAAATTIHGQHFGADAGLHGISTERRTLTARPLYVAMREDRSDGHVRVAETLNQGAAGVRVDQPVAAERGIRAADSRQALQRLAKAWQRRFAAPVLAITGSRGTGTVRAMPVRIFSGLGPPQGTAGDCSNDIGVALPLLRQAAAATCAYAAGVPAPALAAGLAQAESEPGRMQLKIIGSGARLLDARSAANPGSLKAALEVLSACPGEHWLLLGGMGERAKEAAEFHRKAGIMQKEYGVERLCAIGKLTRHSIAAFGPKGKQFPSITALAVSLGGALNDNVRLRVKGSRSMQMELAVKALLANGI